MTEEFKIIDKLIFKSEFEVKIPSYSKKMNNMETFISFKIETKAKTDNYVVERRFNDFLWLDHRLMEKYPVHILAPLPQKHNLTALERFEGPFIEQRLVALETYLIRMSFHPIIGSDETLWSFLTFSESMLDGLKKTYPMPSRFEFIRNSISSFALGSSSAIQHNKINSFSTKTAKILENSATMSSVMNRLCRVLQRTGEIWQSLAQITAVSHPASGGGGDNGSDTDASVALVWQRTIADYSPSCEQISVGLLHDLEPWTRESSLYWDRITQASKRRDSYETKFREATTGTSSGHAPSSPIPEGAVDGLHDNMSRANADLESEIDQFSCQRVMETRRWLDRFAELHVRHYTDSCAVWRRMLACAATDIQRL